MKIPLSRPDISEAEIEAVTAVLRTPFLSLGPKLGEFEEAFAAYIGVPHAVALSSGTAGLALGMQALGIGDGDEVIIPSFSFIAVLNAVLQARAVPVFADIDPISLNLTAATIEPVITPRTRAILLVHTFGYPADVGPILELARIHDLRVIEDACEAIGAERGGRRAGSFGDIGVFSFYPNKPITTGEGGAVVTRDPETAGTLRALRNQGRRAGDGMPDHALAGGNYRLPEMACALGLVQLSRIEAILSLRETVARGYAEALQSCLSLTLPQSRVTDGRISWFAYVVRVPGAADRDGVAAALARDGIDSRAYFPAIHLLPVAQRWRNPAHPLPVSEDAASRTLALPFFNNLQPDEIKRVCRVLADAVSQPCVST